MKRGIKRRGFIKLAAGAASGLALSGCAARTLVPLSPDEEWPVGLDKWVTSTCLQCQGGCGILARVVDGELVKLEGNPLHPINRGRLCPTGQAGLQLLFNPDRLKAPMKRVGGKGSDKWIKISWEEAIKTVADRLIELREAGEPHSLVIVDGQQRGLMRALLERFCDAYGTPNLISSSEVDAMSVAHDLMQGINGPFGYDLERTNYILSFGCDLLDGWRSPVGVARAYGYLRQERPGAKAKVVQVSRRFSATAARADEWIPINPGTEGALALGIAYVIIREDLYERDFVDNYSFGFQDWRDAEGGTHQGFRNLVLAQYRPDDVAAVTGISVDAIIKLAKEFAHAKPAVAIADQNAVSYSNGTYNALAIHALNALVGSIDAPGGVLAEEPVPFKPFPEVKRDAVAERSIAMLRVDRAQDATVLFEQSTIEGIPTNILNEKPYKVNVVFLHNSNPLFSTRVEAAFRRALENIPLVVSFSSFADESAEHADLILPDHCYLEKWQDSIPAPLLGTAVLGIAQPVIKPLYDTMHTGDFVLKLAGMIGGPVTEALPWGDFSEVLKFAVEGIYEAQRGAVFAEPYDEAYSRELQRRGWATNRFSSYDEFWEAALAKGGWSGLYHSYGRWGRIFNTPSNKFEFYSQRLKNKLEAIARETNKTIEAVLGDIKLEARDDRAMLPHHEPMRTEAGEDQYPLFLNPFNTLALNSPSSANLPWIQEVVGPHIGVRWDSWAEINPATADKLGISDGDWVWIESPRGKLKTRAKLYPGARPDTVSVPLGLGHRALGRWAKGRGANPNSIIDLTNDTMSGLPARFSTRVRIYRAHATEGGTTNA
jgi:anaerobic selenocysteine-containing dehydrogenase